LSHHC